MRCDGRGRRTELAYGSGIALGDKGGVHVRSGVDMSLVGIIFVSGSFV